MNLIFFMAIFLCCCTFAYFFYKWNTRPVEWSPKEVAMLLQSWLDGNIEDDSWDYFESCKVSNTELAKIREEALERTLFESSSIEVESGSKRRLNQEGVKKFNELIALCISLDRQVKIYT
jgi:hypothetical protein